MSAPRTLVSKWDRILLVGVCFLTAVTGVFAVQAYTNADATACKGANEAKTAVQSVVDYLNDANNEPTTDPDILAARAANRARAEKLNAGIRTLLAARKC